MHCKPIVQYIDGSDTESQYQGFCIDCIIGTSNYSRTDEKAMAGKQRVLDWIQQKNQNSLLVLKKTFDQYTQFKTSLVSLLDQITQMICNDIKHLENFAKSLDINTKLDKAYLEFEEKNKSIEQEIEYQLRRLIKEIQIDDLLAQSKFLLVKTPLQIDWQYQEIVRRKNENQFQYKLLEKNWKKQNDFCYAIAFNENASLIFFGCGKLIRISKFQEGKILPDEQQIFEYSDYIIYLHFMKKTKTLISSSRDKKVILYDKNDSWYWKTRQVLDDNKSQVYCIVSNIQENLIIYETDQQIKFWQKISYSWVCQFTLTVPSKVFSLSFNDESNKLIASGFQASYALVISQLTSNEWCITQHISTLLEIQSVCYIDSNTFVIQYKFERQIVIYELNLQLNIYEKTQIVQIQGKYNKNEYFQCQFLKEKKILILKYDQYVNILQRLSNGEFMMQQSIDLICPKFYSKATADGEYLVIWNEDTQQFQIRQLVYDF